MSTGSVDDAFSEHMDPDFDQAEKCYSGVFEGPESIAHISFYAKPWLSG
jgi:hypothetical protein